MHKFKTLVLGPPSFYNTLKELKDQLNLNFYFLGKEIKDENIKNFDVIFFHIDILKEDKIKDLIYNSNIIKVMASTVETKNIKKFNSVLKLPATINELNSVLENTVIRNQFNKNSSIKIKDYLLDKNEKKLVKDNKSIILTEKEIKLLELFLNSSKPVTKDLILSKVWNYSTDADTHTVETHIYRLRKKIYEGFSDEKFILNDKKGYCL